MSFHIFEWWQEITRIIPANDVMMVIIILKGRPENPNDVFCKIFFLFTMQENEERLLLFKRLVSNSNPQHFRPYEDHIHKKVTSHLDTHAILKLRDVNLFRSILAAGIIVAWWCDIEIGKRLVAIGLAL